MFDVTRADFYRRFFNSSCVKKTMSSNMAQRATFNVTFRWVKMLRVFESDLKTCSVASKIVSYNITFTWSSIFRATTSLLQVVPCNTALEVSTMRFRDDKQFYSD